MTMQCAIAYKKGDKTFFLEQKSAIWAATLEFLSISTHENRKPMPPFTYTNYTFHTLTSNIYGLIVELEEMWHIKLLIIAKK